MIRSFHFGFYAAGRTELTTRLIKFDRNLLFIVGNVSDNFRPGCGESPLLDMDDPDERPAKVSSLSL